MDKREVSRALAAATLTSSTVARERRTALAAPHICFAPQTTAVVRGSVFKMPHNLPSDRYHNLSCLLARQLADRRSWPSLHRILFSLISFFFLSL